MTLNAITLGVVTVHSTTKRMCRSMRVNVILPITAPSCSRDNYAQTELAIKY